jgi:hypothetical protein
VDEHFLPEAVDHVLEGLAGSRADDVLELALADAALGVRRPLLGVGQPLEGSYLVGETLHPNHDPIGWAFLAFTLLDGRHGVPREHEEERSGADVPSCFWHTFGTLRSKKPQQEPEGLNQKITRFQRLDC